MAGAGRAGTDAEADVQRCGTQTMLCALLDLSLFNVTVGAGGNVFFLVLFLQDLAGWAGNGMKLLVQDKKQCSEQRDDLKTSKGLCSGVNQNFNPGERSRKSRKPHKQCQCQDSSLLKGKGCGMAQQCPPTPPVESH